MLISEIFYSIQGEGELTGIPSVFIRTSGCNLRCDWCDTPYASWEPEGEEMSLEQILAKVVEYSASHCVITGGEPMVAKEIHKLASELKQRGKHITIETAGTVLPEKIPCDLASLSPKLSNSTPSEERAGPWAARHEKTRLQHAVIREWVNQYSYQLKFVVTGETDLGEIKELLGAIESPIPPDKVLLMPEGTDAHTIRGRDDTLMEICKQEGYRYCNRLHIELFGNTRGT
jgi:7-carboxy-7-deazaguanine synthase